tara:strand:+ start:599 stop:3043 length:2445 start_codon:yes stop_codon:yes gene_type:complete
MANGRVQVQGVGSAPKLQAVVNAGGQYRVQTQQAGRNKMMDLADSLSLINPILKEYAAIQEINYDEGFEKGAMEAAQGELKLTTQKMDQAGEKLVNAGLMPRSQLMGYQQGFRKRIGERTARTSFYTGLYDRLNEVRMNPESPEDVVGRIINEERAKAIQQLDVLGGSQLALEGFTEYSAAVENNFLTNATKARGAAVEEHNENMVIEELNADYGTQVLTAKTPEERALLQNSLKAKLDSLSTDSKIERSRVVELFWNGFAVPNVTNLLSGENPQPDKAEEMLETILDIDLTGKGGKLGNINREGAYIRSRSVEIRNRIQAARVRLEADEDDVAEDIVNMFTAASNAIQTGPTDDEEINKRDLTAISRMLKDAGYAGYDGMVADDIAKQLYENSDLPTFMKYLNKYLDNDSKRDAYNKASQAFKRLNLVSAQLQSHYLTKRELPLLIEQFKTAKRADPTLTSSEFLQAGGGIKGAPITDKSARAALGKIELADEKKKWFEGTDVQRNEESNFKTQLTTLTEGVWTETKVGKIDLKVAPFATPFLNRYDTLVREASERLTDLSPEERDEAMNKAVTEIKTDLLGRWTRLQQTQKAVEEQKLDPIEKVELVDNEELEDAERDVQNLLSYWETFTIKQGLNLARFISDDEIPDPFLTIGEQDYDTRQNFGAVSPVRSRALNAVEGYEEALKDSNKLIEKYDDTNAPELYKELVTKLRERFGYRSIDEVPDYKVGNVTRDPVDYRVTPVVGTVEDLGKTLIKWRDEAKVFTALPLEKQNIEDPEFSTLKKMRDKFGVGISAAQITAFRDAQLKLFNTR